VGCGETEVLTAAQALKETQYPGDAAVKLQEMKV